MFFPKAAAVLLCAAALTEAFSIPDVGHLALRSPQNFGNGGGNFSGQNKANNNNNNAAKANSGGGNTKTSTTAAAAATKAATSNNNGNNNAAASAVAGTACLKSNAVQTGSADDGNATPTDGQAASAT